MLDPDVTAILDDPDVGGGVSFTVKRSKSTRIKGSVYLSTEEIPATGNIQPSDKSMNQRVNEDELNEQIVIRTTQYLQNGSRIKGETFLADEIIFDDARWKVTRVENWKDWGFVTAYATKIRE